MSSNNCHEFATFLLIFQKKAGILHFSFAKSLLSRFIILPSERVVIRVRPRPDAGRLRELVALHTERTPV
jgi:hypothetical protein